jgi:glycerol-3-phosphate acyltransferase PlsY
VLLLYFSLGLLSDFLVTAYYIFVAKQWASPAALISIPIALLNFWVIDKVLITMTSWPGAIAYACGNAVGCFLIMSLRKKIEKHIRKNESR